MKASRTSLAELREQDVARLTARNADLETELRRVEQHNLNLMKDNIALKQVTPPAAQAKSRAK